METRAERVDLARRLMAGDQRSSALGIVQKRIARARLRHVDESAAAADAARLWGADSPEARVLKASVGAATPIAGAGWDASALNAVDSAGKEFWTLIHPSTVVGKMPALRRVPFNVRLIGLTAGATATWMGPGKPMAVTKDAMQAFTFPERKLGAIKVVTEEVVKLGGLEAEAYLDSELEAAPVELLDSSFLDAANTGITDEKPASVTAGVSPITSSGSAVADVAALIAAFSGDLGVAVFVTDPTLAAQIALTRVSSTGPYAFPNASVRGDGNILGIPLLVSKSSPRAISGSPSVSRGQLALIDPSGVAFGGGAVNFERSTQGTIEMSDAPTNSPTFSGSPQTVHATNHVSLFQTNSVALKVTIYVNWQVVRPCVQVVTGARYLTT